MSEMDSDQLNRKCNAIRGVLKNLDITTLDALILMCESYALFFAWASISAQSKGYDLNDCLAEIPLIYVGKDKVFHLDRIRAGISLARQLILKGEETTI